MLKPIGYLIDDKEVFGTHDLFSNLLERYIKEDRAKPLYAIPEGYHITAINNDQAIKDSLEQRNDNLRMDDE